MPYKVGEVNYSVTSFSNKIITHCDGPKDDLENNVTRKNYKKSKKTLFIPPIALFLVFYLAMFIGITSANIDATSAALGAVIGLIIMCFPMGCAFVFWQMIHDKAWEKISKKEVDIINYQREEKKYKHLTKLLKEMNFKPLSKEEISRFSHLNKDGAKMNLFEKFLLWLANLSFKKK